MGRVSLVVGFFVLTPILLIASLISLISMDSTKPTPDKKGAATNNYQSTIGISVYASLPATVPSITGEVKSADARPEIVKKYLTFYNSPLIPYAEEIVEISDKYGLDFRLIPAIAQQESNLCKVIPPGSHNCWGWGINSASNLGFESYSHAIETVSRGIKRGYLDEGLTTPDAIMTKYTPHSDGSWARGVNEFMAAMQ